MNNEKKGLKIWVVVLLSTICGFPISNLYLGLVDENGLKRFLVIPGDGWTMFETLNLVISIIACICVYCYIKKHKDKG